MASRAASKRQRFAELKALRASGKKAFDTYEVEQENELYEEVDEEKYKKIVRARLDQDDFVVDDNGEGYADDGREEWDRPEQYYSDESEDGMVVAPKKSGKSGKKAREEEQAKREANDRNISEYFTKGQTKIQHRPKVAKTKEDDDFLAGLLDEVDANVPAPAPRPSKRPRSPERRRVRIQSPSRDSRQPTKKARISEEPSSPPIPATTANGYDNDDGPLTMDMDDDLVSVEPAVPMSDPAPSSPMARAAERKAGIVKIEPDAEDDEEDDMEVAHTATVKSASVNVSATRQPNKLLKKEPKAVPMSSSPAKPVDSDIDSSSWNNIASQLNVVSSQSTETSTIGKLDAADVVEADGSLNFFWTDYTEANGTLCLFGKVLNKKNNTYASCFVQVTNILRKLYFLPRENKVIGEQETDEGVSMVDVYNEVDHLLSKVGVTEHKSKKCNRKYAFELAGVPPEAEYLKVLYSYQKQALPQTSGETFSHVFGANTALFEQFVLWKNVMGPCWLKIKDADFAQKNASYCKLEVQVDHPGKMIDVLSDSEGLDAPPFTIMTLAMRTIFNMEKNKQEILALSARVYENVSLTETTPAEKLPCRTFTLVRPNGGAFPMGFEAMARSRKRGLIKTCRVEREMLSFFLSQVGIADPDVIMGHQLEGANYSVLLNRLQEHKVPQWSILGRLRKSSWPSSMSKMGGNVFAERQVMSGRLLCDLSNDAGKSVMFKCSSWSLTEMCGLYLSAPNNKRRDVDSDAALKSWASTKDGLLDYITHLETDTYFISALALRTQILPLTKVLTNLAGNSWARVLTGTRAERNEYILLHEFHRNKYIVPDKQTFRGRKAAEEEARGGADDEDGGAGDSKKKDKYKGGLVFEPEKGLYDKYVLVMDFNSLYPSIIQEYNICFTTVKRPRIAAKDEEEIVPDVPQQQEQGILPKLIATLVQRRRQVKKMMKDKSATPEQLATWDIRQLALKLTANSMYGCLGYTKSRFYARPLAVLTTFKGREILRSTKELAESKSLQVIYGDTDSVMINANVNNVADALRVGREFKECVNERYRLLEIDIDNIFRRILLQAKKKYAAINLSERDGRWEESMEVKGLDMKRREYCALSKEVSTRILHDILSGDDIEAVVARIHEYLRTTAGKMRDSQIPPAKYVIYTQLGKNPQDYPNKDGMPQVQVALREMARGKTFRKGDVVSYIITTGDGGASASSSDPAPKRAFPPQDVLRAAAAAKVKQETAEEPQPGALEPDVEWYIAKQIFPPVERLCANITGTSTPQLAENLGLDIKRYSSASGSASHSSSGGLEDIHPLESQISDTERFASCVRLQLRCRGCKTSSPFLGLSRSPAGRVTRAGIVCPCGKVMPNLSVVAQVEAQLRAASARYYEGWLICRTGPDGEGCGRRTRQVSCGGDRRCLGPDGRGAGGGCSGTMGWEVGEREAYNQLLYFAGLFDVDKARAEVEKAAKAGGKEAEIDDGEGGTVRVDPEAVLALAEQNRVRFSTVKGAVEAHLRKCGRQCVQMGKIFGSMGFSAAAGVVDVAA